MLLIFAQAVQAACPAPASPDDLMGAVVRGELAFQDGDPASLSQSAQALRGLVPCLSAPLGMSQSAGVFRLWGYDAFVARDKARAAKMFAIAKDLQPDYVMPPVVVPEHHPMRALYDETEPLDPETKLLELPEGHSARVNGIESVVHPVSQTFLFQQLDVDGVVVASGVFGPGEPPSIYEAPPENPPPEVGLSVLGNMGFWLRQGRATGTFGPAVRVDVPLVSGLGADAALSLGLSAVKEGVVLVPDLRLGLRWEVDGEPRPRFGAALLLASHGDATVAPGAAITLGVRAGSLDIDGRVGWAGGLTIGVAAGVAVF